MNNMRSFVKFIRPDKKNSAGASKVVEVKTRDLEQLDIPPAADFFYFYDAGINPKDGHMNQSPVHIVAERLLTREEAKLLLAPDPRTHSQIKWDMKLEKNETFALTRSNNIEPVSKHNIVIDAKRHQLYPEPAPKPPVLPADFKMVCERPIIAPPPAKFRPRKPDF